MFARSFFTRSLKGDVPVQIPILLFVYTIIFLVVIEIVMLFFLQSSLNTAARQIAILAGNNTKFPLTENGPALRCQEAVQKVGGVFPGYSARVRDNYIDAVVNKNKTGPLSDFDETAEAESGRLRERLVTLGAARPATFWGGSRADDVHGGNASFGGCYALRNPSTHQIVFHTVVHCSGCWPVFLKGFQKFSGDANSAFALTAWLEGRGSAPASSNGITDNLNLNKSLLSSGPRPLVWCTANDCNVDHGGDQNDLVASNDICRDFTSSPSRPTANSIKIGSKEGSYAVDQKNNTGSAFGVARLRNCGDIDPLIFVGLRYASMGNDAFGRVLRNGGSTPADSSSADFLGQTDNYILFKPACNGQAVKMDKVVGDITNLNGNLGPCIVRQDSSQSANTKLVCRTDSAKVRPWLGPYIGGAATAVQEHASSNTNGAFPFDGKAIGTNLSSASILGSSADLTSPLDNIAPYHALCDICNPGSPKCGMYGTCRNESNVWPQTNGANKDKPEIKSAHVLQIWTNTPFFNLQPQKIQIECRYRRDCNEKHCCLAAMEEGILETYCANRGILDGDTRFGQKCSGGQNRWTYKGVPNFQAEPIHTSQHLYRAGGFPHCSTASVRLWKMHAGECCAPDVVSADLPCGNELAPQVQLMPPNMTCASGLRECGGGSVNSRYCPGEPPELEGNCLKENENYPIGGENPGGPAGMPGSDLAVAPANVPRPPDSYCLNPPDITAKTTQCPGGGFKCTDNVTKTKTEESGNTKTTTTTTAQSCVSCSPTPLIILFDLPEPVISPKKTCFSLNHNYKNNSYTWLKGSLKQGFIVYDFNKNGIIDNGTELFGNVTKDRYYASGYAALHFTIDQNKDGLVNGAELKDLLIWFDLNEDGYSQASELKKATDLGIIELDAGLYLAQRVKKKIFTKDGSAFASSYSAKGYKLKDKKGIIKKGYTWDINLQGQENQKCQNILKIRQAELISKKKRS